MKRSIQLLVTVLTISLVSCEAIDQPEELPSYIKIDSVRVDYKNPSVFGVGQPNIPDVWLNVDGSEQGIYNLPNTIAIKEDGNVDISVRAGIKVNGIAATRNDYPFYTRFDTTINIDDLDTVSFIPTVSYNPNTEVLWKENFEQSAVTLKRMPTGDVDLERVQVDSIPYKENYVAYTKIDTGARMHFALTSNNFATNTFVSAPVFIEMDYKATSTFNVNLRYEDTEGVIEETPIIYMNPSTENGEAKWNKIYIDISDRVLATRNAQRYGISISAAHNTSNPPAEFYFDNFKLLRL